MVRGLEWFAKRFAGFQDCYVLIGGAAAYLVQEEAGLEPRATGDLDIVLCVESLTAEFGQRMWDFIEEGATRCARRERRRACSIASASRAIRISRRCSNFSPAITRMWRARRIASSGLESGDNYVDR